MLTHARRGSEKDPDLMEVERSENQQGPKYDRGILERLSLGN